MKRFFTEFKEFINRGNVMDLAVAVVLGAAFTAIINSLVSDFVTPLLSLLTLGIDFSSFSLTLGSGDNAAVIKYGSFVQATVNFLVIALVVFFMVKGVNTLTRRKIKEAPPLKDCPYCAQKIPEAAVRCPNCTTILDASKIPEDLR